MENQDSWPKAQNAGFGEKPKVIIQSHGEES